MNIEIWLFAIAVLWVPGAAVARVLKVRETAADAASVVTLQLALGMSFWPVVFLWTSLIPLQWTGGLVRAVVGVAAIVAFFRKGGGRFVRWITFWSALLAAILVVTGWTRLRAIDGIVLPPWVDAVHHTMLVRLFLMRGTVPATYEPFLTDANAFYHWGFHAIAAALSWFAGRTDAFGVPAVMLSFGQWLNALTPLFVYAAARALARSRAAAIVAAALAGLVSYYPAYYVSWGRYTHLAGVLLLLAWIALAASIRRPTPRSAAALAFVAAGLGLIHVRLAFFAATFTLVLIVAHLLRHRRRTAAFLLASGMAAAIVLVPWLVQMRRIAGTAIAPSEARWTTPSDVAGSNLWVPHAAELLSVATAGISGMANIGAPGIVARVLSVVWWLAVIAVAMRRPRPKTLIALYALLAAWIAVTLLVMNGTRLQFASNTSAAITMWVPVCIAAGALIAWVARRRAAIVAVVVVCAVIGVATLQNVINPGTIIAGEADVAALRWFHSTTPAGSAIIGRVRGWYGGAFIGADGAYWASVLTDRRSLPPPTLYRWTDAPESRAEVALFLARWQSEYPNVGASTLAEARRLGVTHVYFGRGVEGSFGTEVYARDGVSIRAVGSGLH